MAIRGIRVRRCSGLSLIELMLVLMAMMIMVGASWKAASAVIDHSRKVHMAAEISGLSKGIDAFAVQFGDYPPDFHDSVAVWKFLKRCFPKCPWQKCPDFCGYSPAGAAFLAGRTEGAGVQHQSVQSLRRRR